MQLRTKMVSILILLSLLTFLPLLSALPTPTIIQQNGWQITHTTDTEFTPWIDNSSEKKTELGLIPSSGVCPLETKRLYNSDGSELLDNKDKPIDVKCESSKCDGENCYHISLTEAALVNAGNYIKIGEASTVYEWLNSTLYIYETDKLDLDPFEIEILCNNVKLETPDISFISKEPIEEGVKFSANVSNFTCEGKITFRQNQLIQENLIWNNQFGGKTKKHFIDYSDFENSEDNNITSQNIT